MPVNRQFVTVQNRQTGGNVRAAATTDGTNFRQMAQMFGRRAADYAEVMAAASEDEARALAKAAVFSTDPETGMPRLKGNPAERMGEIGRRVFNASIEDRLLAQMSIAIQAQIGELANANIYDPEAFEAAAFEAAEKMREGVPDGLQGVFQEMVTGAIVDAQTSIGFRRGQLNIETRRQEIPGMVEHLKSRITEQILLNTPEGDSAARIMAEQLEWIDNESDAVMGPEEKRRYKMDIMGHAATQLLIRNEKLLDASPGQIQELIVRLETGEDEALREYFQYEGEYSQEMARAAIGTLNQLLGRANSIAQEKDARERQAIDMDRVAFGHADGTEKDKAALDMVLASQLRLYDKDGTIRPMHPAEWATLSFDQRNMALAQIKRSGFVPKSMSDAFNQIDRSTDPNDFAGMFSIYRGLKEIGGAGMDMTKAIPERALTVFTLADAMAGDGGVGQEHVVDALTMILTNEANAENWGEEQFAASLFRQRDLVDERHYKPGSKDTAIAQTRRWLITSIFEGVDALESEKEIAWRMFETYVQAGYDVTEARSYVEQGMAGRFAETTIMMDGTRSDYAPEKWYADRGPRTWKEWWQNIKDAGKARGARGLENIGFWPAKLIGIDPEDYGVEFGDDFLEASTFELIADKQIREYLKSNPRFEEVFGTDRRIYRAGEQYKLRATHRTGGPPVYQVFMKHHQTNRFVPIPGFELDVRKDWERIIGVEAEIEKFRRDQKLSGDLGLTDAQWQLWEETFNP